MRRGCPTYPFFVRAKRSDLLNSNLKFDSGGQVEIRKPPGGAGSYPLFLAQEERVVEPARHDAAGQWANPVDTVVGPVIRGQCGTKGARRIERRPGKRAAEQ